MRIIIVITLFSLNLGLSAQINAGDPDDNEFHLFDGGFSLGANFTQVDGDDLAGFNKIGINVGPIIHINFNPNWSASMELLYSQKGARSKPDPNNVNTFILVMDYAEVPIMANYNDKNRLIFQAGFSYGRLVNSREKINGIEQNIEGVLENDELSYIVGGTFLVGEKKHFGVNLRYQGSITKVGPSANPKVVGLINRLVTARATYYF